MFAFHIVLRGEKMNIAVIFGGESVEHDVSVLTGLSVMKNLSKKYTIVPIYITHSGIWLTGKALLKNSIYEKQVQGNSCYFANNSLELCVKHWFKTTKVHIDCALLCLHGGLGEGGGVQGVLETNHVPYTSCGVGASSVCMDKVFTKLICRALLIDILPFVSGTKESIQSKVAENKLDYPLIVKPAHCGSSVGISIANNEADLGKSLELSCQFDDKILIEPKLGNFRELNIAVLVGNEKIEFSEIEEVICEGIYDFEHKYKVSNTKRVVPAEIDEAICAQIKHIVTLFCRECDIFGAVRFDFLLGDKLYLNEVNTIPGNLAFYLWKNLSYTKLLSILIENAIRRKNNKNHITQIKTNLLNNLDSIKPICHK